MTGLHPFLHAGQPRPEFEPQPESKSEPEAETPPAWGQALLRMIAKVRESAEQKIKGRVP